MKKNKTKRCMDCKYYPNDCGYWEKDFRKKNNGVKKDTEHNCPDFSPFEFHTKEEWDFLSGKTD